MCDCHSRVRDSLLARFKEAQPAASGHQIELQGYGFAVVNGTITLKPFMEYKASADFPMKKGDMTKWKGQTGKMVFSFCPFCGESLSAGSPAAQGADTQASAL